MRIFHTLMNEIHNFIKLSVLFKLLYDFNVVTYTHTQFQLGVFKDLETRDTHTSGDGNIKSTYS